MKPRALGGFTFVLHSHLPFYRGAGVWPHGEEALHEVMAECYVPLLEALTDLREAGVPARITLGITPVLLEQLADDLVIANFESYLGRKIDAAADDVGRFQRSGDQHFLYLAHFYLNRYRHVLLTFQDRFRRDIVGGFKALQVAGSVEILTSGATHPYLPLMARDSTVYAQLEVGKRTTERHFGRAPRAIWLPECAYRPGYYAPALDGTSYPRPGLEDWLETQGLRLFFAESDAVEQGRLVGRDTSENRDGPRPVAEERTASGVYGGVARALESTSSAESGFVTTARVVPYEGSRRAAARGGTYEPYYVRGTDVAVLGRNRLLGRQVWSAEVGYPGEASYREFHRKDAAHGLQYWRVTEGKPDLAYKQPYEPFRAGKKVSEHAAHFVALVESQLAGYMASREGRRGFIVSTYDTELFGHWWFEGIDWLKEVLTGLAASESVDLCTASEWLDNYPPTAAIDLPESSWGHGGNHSTWLNPDTGWMWAQVHEGERRMEGLVARVPHPTPPAELALNQAARELLLLEASDWEFLVTTGQARQYAIDRFTEHVSRFNRLAGALDTGSPADDESAASLALEYSVRDNLFPDVDYRLFAARQPE